MQLAKYTKKKSERCQKLSSQLKINNNPKLRFSSEWPDGHNQLGFMEVSLRLTFHFRSVFLPRTRQEDDA